MTYQSHQSEDATTKPVATDSQEQYWTPEMFRKLDELYAEIADAFEPQKDSPPSGTTSPSEKKGVA